MHMSFLLLQWVKNTTKKQGGAYQVKVKSITIFIACILISLLLLMQCSIFDCPILIKFGENEI